MIARVLVLAGGLSGAAGLSQFPEFSQQYVQRLGGAVDELHRVVGYFDASAAAEGMSRTEALEAMQGTPFLERRRADMERVIARAARLEADLVALDQAGPFTRLYLSGRLRDGAIAAGAVAAFRPAVPLSFEGAAFAAFGLLTGMGAVSGVIGVLRRLLPRRRPTSA